MIMHTQLIVCATVQGQCLEYLGYINLLGSWFHMCYNPITKKVNKVFSPFFFCYDKCARKSIFFDPFVELFISMKIDSYIPSKSCLTYFI